MKKVAGTLKLIYSQFRELQSFSQFGSDLDADTKSRLEQGERIVEILKQDKNSPVDVELQVALIYAATNGYLKDVKIEDVKKYEKGLYSFLKDEYSSLLEQIKKTGELSKVSEEELKKALKEYTEKFLKK